MTIVLGCLLILLSVASLFVGVIDVNIPGLFSGDLEQWKVFLISRIPRLLAILCTGVGMSVAGLIMQQLCMNKFVSPTTGATISSAQFGILLALLFMPASTIWSRALFAFVCAVLGTWIFVWFIQRIQFKDVVMVPLVGIMFGNVIGGITNYLAYKYEMTQALSSWLVGHFSVVLSGNYELVWLAVPLVILAFLFANHFNIVGMGKDFSKNLGVPYNLVLFLGLSVAAMITASVVVVVGSISYIGLIVPNVVAMFKGDKIRGTLVDTALFGAVFVLVCDMAARVVISPYELPIELNVGIIGSVLFVGLLLYRLKHGRKAIRLGPAHGRGLRCVRAWSRGEAINRDFCKTGKSCKAGNHGTFGLGCLRCLLTGRCKPQVLFLRHEPADSQAHCHAHCRLCHRGSLPGVSIHHQQPPRYPLPAGNELPVHPHPHSGGVCGGFRQHSGCERQCGLRCGPGADGPFRHGDLRLPFQKDQLQRAVCAADWHGAHLVLWEHPVHSHPHYGPQRVRQSSSPPWVASFSNVNAEIIVFSLVVLALLIVALRRDLALLDVLTLGKEQAINLGGGLR